MINEEYDIPEVKRCVIYTRVSTEEQAKHGDSIDTQIAYCHQYAREHGMVIIDEYKDEGVSAFIPWQKRKELMRLLDELPEKKPDCILTTKIDRWTRRMEAFYDIRKILVKNQCDLICFRDNLETRVAKGEYDDNNLKVQFFLMFAEEESSRTGKRIREIFALKEKSGFATSGAVPWGFVLEDKEHNKRYLKDPDLEEIVPIMFSTFLKHHQIVAVRREMEKLGHAWSTETWRARLTNEKYTGEYKGIKNYCPAYVSREDWEKVQEILKGNSVKTTPKGTVYLFSSLIKCPYCGYNLVAAGTAHKNTEYLYYRCYQHYKVGCPMSRRVREDRLEAWLLDNLEKQFKLDKKAKLKKAKPKPKPKGSRKIDYVGQLRRLTKAYTEGMVPEDDYFEQATELKKKIDEQKKEEVKVNPERVEKAAEQIVGFRKAYEGMTKESKRIFWHQILKEIHVDKDGNVTELVFAY